MSTTIVLEELLELELEQVHPAKDNPRRKVGDVDELADSIRAMGVIEPLVAVRENGHFLLVAGARRHAAAKKAGLKTVPVR